MSLNIAQTLDCCCIGTYDSESEYCEFFKVKMIRAKKEHICCECKKKILPGKLYEYVFGVWGSDPSSFKTCSTCAAIRHDYCPNALFGELKETIKECLGKEII